jgi:plastocyanin
VHPPRSIQVPATVTRTNLFHEIGREPDRRKDRNAADSLRAVWRAAGTTAGLTVLAVGALAAPADPHPGHGPPQIAVADHKFTPATLQVYERDSVLFVWPGPDTDHSATADDGSFDSDSGKSPGLVLHKINDYYAVEFSKAGTYSFHCKVHPDMTGTITVKTVPNDVPLAGPPTFSRLTAKPARLCTTRSRHCAHPGTTLRFTLSEPGDVRALITRRGSHRVAREIDFSAPPGPGRRRISFGSLAPGRYRITLVAIDAATGTSGPRRHVDVRVRR